MTDALRLYDDDADALMDSSSAPDRVTLLPGELGPIQGAQRLRILWGHDMLRDVLDARYRVIVCGVNDLDNTHGLISQIVNLVSTSQWTPKTVTSYARVFHESVHVHAAADHEPYVLKYDLDSVMVLALLRPKDQDHFTIDDLSRGMTTVSKMLAGRRERLPVAAVSFLGARSNKLVGSDGREPSFETVLRTMYESGFRGDVYPAPQMWSLGQTGVYATYPFPESLARMRGGSS